MTKILTANGWKPLDEGLFGKKKPKNPEEPYKIDHEHWVDTDGIHKCFIVARKTEELKKPSARRLNRPDPTHHVPPDVVGHLLMQKNERGKWERFPPEVYAEEHKGKGLEGAMRDHAMRFAERDSWKSRS